MSLKLKELEIKGFKSISKEGQRLSFGDVTVLLGANGSGKSNLVSFFQMLRALIKMELQVFVSTQGGANAILNYGAKNCPQLTAKLEIADDNKDFSAVYSFDLIAAMPDRLIFTSEKMTHSEKGITVDHGFMNEGSESMLPQIHGQAEQEVHEALKILSVYHFHDTSNQAAIKQSVYAEDAIALRSDGGNLAAFLRRLKEDRQLNRYYQRIVRHIQQVMPQFGDFELTLMSKNLSLNWREKGKEMLFGPHQISDGSLRFMALATLLLQPPELLPSVIILDEPELGLHPAAIVELAAMVRIAAKHSQVILATQSPRLVDEFKIEDLIVAERVGDHSEFKRLESEALKDWLARYSLSELWDKNVLGGRP